MSTVRVIGATGVVVPSYIELDQGVGRSSPAVAHHGPHSIAWEREVHPSSDDILVPCWDATGATVVI